MAEGAAEESRLAGGNRFLEAVLDTMADGVVACDAEGMLALFNRATREFHGIDEERLPPERWAERYDLYRADGVTLLSRDEIPLVRAYRGESVRGAEMVIAPRDGRRRIILASGRPIYDADGVQLGAVCSMTDITEQRRAEAARRLAAAEQAARAEAEAGQRRLALLAEVSEVLDEELSSERRVARLVELVVPRLADSCRTYLREGHLLVPVGPGVGVRGEGPVAVGTSHPVARTAEAGVPELIGAPTGADREALGSQAGSALVLPLRARGRTFGALVLTRRPGRAAYLRAELPLAEDVARRAALALENALLYERQSHIARVLQESLLPPRLPEIPGIDLAARYLPGGEGNQVGGDFYDLFEVGAGDWALTIGDVCGKGPEAAALTALIRYTMRAGAPGRAPGAVLAGLNEAIIRQRGDGRFCTAVAARLRVSWGAGEGAAGPLPLRLASGGHPPPALLHGDGAVERLPATGPLIGVFPGLDYGEHRLALGQGDALVLYTDGLTEARRERQSFGDSRLERVLAASTDLDAGGLAERLVGAATDFADGRRDDDIAVLVVRALR